MKVYKSTKIDNKQPHLFLLSNLTNITLCMMYKTILQIKYYVIYSRIQQKGPRDVYSFFAKFMTKKIY